MNGHWLAGLVVCDKVNPRVAAGSFYSSFLVFKFGITRFLLCRRAICPDPRSFLTQCGHTVRWALPAGTEKDHQEAELGHGFLDIFRQLTSGFIGWGSIRCHCDFKRPESVCLRAKGSNMSVNFSASLPSIL